MRLRDVDHRSEPGAWARSLGVSEAACRLVLESHFIDLHCDVEVPVRLFGYDPARRHGPDRHPWPLVRHTDYPRCMEAGFSGLVVDVPTNVFKGAGARLAATWDNLARIEARVACYPDELALVRSGAEYRDAVARGQLALFFALQGGNALSTDVRVLEGPLGDVLHRVTLVHLTSSDIGGTSSPLQPDRGLTGKGRQLVELCNARRVLVDLAHAGQQTFWDVIEVHDPNLPVIVSHTGVSGVRPHWRNLDDRQLRAVADRGGVVGVLFHGPFLGPWGVRGPRRRIVEHLAYAIDRIGEDFVAIGTDYDGMILPPGDLADVTHQPRLVQDMLDRGWSAGRIRKILGGNYLRVLDRIG